MSLMELVVLFCINLELSILNIFDSVNDSTSRTYENHLDADEFKHIN